MGDCVSHQIVVVDDEHDILTVVAEVLRFDGYAPITFANSQGALEYLLTNRPELIITDLLMPGVSGQELVAQVRKRYGNVPPIIVMSASVNFTTAAMLPVQAFVGKPFDLDDISSAVQRCLEP